MEFTDDFGSRQRTLYRRAEAAAHASLKGPVKVEGPLEIRTPTGSTSDFLKIAAEVLASKHLERAGSSSGFSTFPVEA